MGQGVSGAGVSGGGFNYSQEIFFHNIKARWLQNETVHCVIHFVHYFPKDTKMAKTGIFEESFNFV